jgi:hypothetical protein
MESWRLKHVEDYDTKCLWKWKCIKLVAFLWYIMIHGQQKIKFNRYKFSVFICKSFCISGDRVQWNPVAVLQYVSLWNYAFCLLLWNSCENKTPVIARFEFLIAVLLNIHVFWYVTPCLLAGDSDVSEARSDSIFTAKRKKNVVLDPVWWRRKFSELFRYLNRVKHHQCLLIPWEYVYGHAIFVRVGILNFRMLSTQTLIRVTVREFLSWISYNTKACNEDLFSI